MRECRAGYSAVLTEALGSEVGEVESGVYADGGEGCGGVGGGREGGGGEGAEVGEEGGEPRGWGG